MSEIRVDETDARWDASRLEGREENSGEKDLDEGVTEIGGGS